MVNSDTLDVILRWCEKYKDDPEYNKKVWDLRAIHPFDWTLLTWNGAAPRSDEQFLDIIYAAVYLRLSGLQARADCVWTKRRLDEEGASLYGNETPSGNYIML